MNNVLEMFSQSILFPDYCVLCHDKKKKVKTMIIKSTMGKARESQYKHILH